VTPYPVRFDVEYPDRSLNRLTTFFRPFVAIPILIVAGTVSGGTIGSSPGDNQETFVAAGGVLFLGPLLMIVFRARYPGWWWDWNLNLIRFGARIGAFMALLDDEYPSTEDEQAVRFDMPRPDVAAGDVSRGLPIVKWLLAIPHYIVLFFLWIGVVIAVIVAWFAILFTGRYPRGLFDYVVGVGRWHLRVAAYAFVLVTDDYPPFRLGA
jgi:hypothetical protein